MLAVWSGASAKPAQDVRSLGKGSRIAGNDQPVPGMEGQGGSLPVGDHAAGAANDRTQRKLIVDVEVNVDAKVDAAGRDLGVGHAATTVHAPTGGRLHPFRSASPACGVRLPPSWRWPSGGSNRRS